MNNFRTENTRGGSRAASRTDDGHGDDLRKLMHRGLRHLTHESAILAVGCDQAFLGAQLAEYAADVTVLDTSAAQIGMLAPRFREIGFLQHNPTQPLPFPRDTFDAIWCCEFLDRVFNPVTALQEMYRVMKPGGELRLTVPDHGRVRNVLIALFRWDQHFAPANPRIRHFTRTMLHRMALETGFVGISFETAGAVRRGTGGLVPRTLMLSARKPLLARAAGGRSRR
jgi:ubiquinone/menaquinone biosynthesis C-methylase UbiE